MVRQGVLLLNSSPDGQGASAQIAQRTGLGTAHRHVAVHRLAEEREGIVFYALGIGCHQERGRSSTGDAILC